MMRRLVKMAVMGAVAAAFAAMRERRRSAQAREAVAV